MSYWRQRAENLIAELVKDLPEDATPAQRKKALWGKGWPAHQDTSWGKKMWGKAVREHLARHDGSQKIGRFKRVNPATGQVETVDLFREFERGSGHG